LRDIMKQLLTAIKYMHSANYVHRDLKPENILVRKRKNGPSEFKLADFGLARSFTENDARPSIASEKIFPFATSVYDKTVFRFKKKISKHVVTRYYRAPEISLLMQERSLCDKMDIWSMGCILGELLQMIPGNEINGKRKVLMRGACDLVLSPKKGNISTQQLNIIFQVLGTPSAEYIENIQNEHIRRWVLHLKKKTPMNFNALFPEVSEECIDFLKGMLEYDPSKRMSPDECLQHPWLSVEEDDHLNMARDPVCEDFEDVFLTGHELRLMLIDEILHYNPEWRNHLTYKQARELVE